LVTEAAHAFANFNRGLIDRYNEWMIAMHYAKSTKQIYLNTLRLYDEFLAGRSIARADHSDIRSFIAHLSENGATLTKVYRDLGVLRLFYDFLNLGGVVSYVAPRFVRLRVPWSGRPGVLSEAQVQRLISATRTPRERALVEFFYATGCRLGEVRFLKIEHMDLAARTATVHGKLGKSRLVLLTESAAKAVRSYIGDRRRGYVFQPEQPIQRGCLSLNQGRWISQWTPYAKSGQHRRLRHKFIGSFSLMTEEEARKKHEEFIESLHLSRPSAIRALSQMAIQCVIRKLSRLAGLNRVTPHTLRRTFATHLHENGASLEVIRTLMGHVWVQTTMRYARVGPDAMARQFEKCHPMGNRYEPAQK
jgi:site-specific recombinase XerD